MEMARSVILAVAILLSAIIVVVALKSNLSKYEIVAAGNGAAYKLERRTGTVWLIAGDQAMIVKSKGIPATTTIP